jgi:hypothetical protein
MTRLIDTDSEESTQFIPCPSCEGCGYFEMGDCEEGCTDVCPECDGLGEVEI